MNKMIDPRSLLTGLVLGATTVLCLGAALRHTNQPGRFQLGVGDGQTAYVIDTVSGQVWQKKNSSSRSFSRPRPKRANSEAINID